MTNASDEPQSNTRVGGLTGVASLAGLAMLLLIGAGWGWSAHRGRAEAEAALAAAVAERDAAVQAADAAKVQLAKAQAASSAGTAKVAELEQQVQALDGLLAGASADLSRLRAELASRAEAEATVAAEKAEEATSQPQPAIAAVEPAAAPPAAVPAPPPPAKPESLTITFDVNSSYLPDDLNGRLRALAQRLEPDRSYHVKLVGAVGGGVAGKSVDEAQRYNRWMAERRIERVANYLQRTTKADKLKIAREFAANDPSRRVVVEVTAAVD